MSAVEFVLNGVATTAPADGRTLLEALRGLGITSTKDGCSPQGQCGCCTVWVDGQPRVACVTPLVRIAGRSVVTLEGLAEAREWGERLCASGGSQCGFCTPGIVMRLAAIAPAQRSEASVRQGLLAHLCRCTGWNTVVEAALAAPGRSIRDFAAAGERARLEGGTEQRVSPDVALGHGGFVADSAPPDVLIAVLDPDGEWVVGESLVDARRRSGKVQGRRTTEPLTWPLEVPAGEWVRTLRTTWLEPAYLEPDAAWCEPGGTPVGPLCNGGAFGGKASGDVGSVAQRLARQHGRPVLALYSREDVVRLGAKRPPLAVGVRADGTGVVRMARTAGVASAIAAVAPGLVVEEVDVPGPVTSSSVRAAGWAEALVLLAPDDGWVTAPNGARAFAVIDDSGVRVTVACGRPLDEVVLRSYCIGATHMALGWVRHEGITVSVSGDPLDLTIRSFGVLRHEGITVSVSGDPLDLTIRSFGVLRAVDTPVIDVTVVPSDAPPVNGSDAVFAAVALAAWRASGFAPRWPTMRT